MEGELVPKAQWEIESEKKRQDLIDKLRGPLDGAYEEIGLNLPKLAAKRKEQLCAKAVKHIKLKGYAEEDLNLPRGYRQICKTVGDKPENSEILIEYKGPDYPTQLKAADSIERNRGWQGPDKVEQKNTGTIIVQSSIPEPLPVPDYFLEEVK